MGPRSFKMPITASNWSVATANGALLTVAMRCPATALTGSLAGGVVFANLAVLQLGHPNAFHPLGFQNPDIFVADHMAFGQQLFPARTEYRATQDPSG